MPGTKAHHLRTYLVALLLFILLIALAFVITTHVHAPQTEATEKVAATLANFPPEAPAPTAKDYVTAQHGFQYLVQYTDTGFHPSALSVKKGETVRFTNITDSTLALDSDDVSLSPHTYYEKTFATAGTFPMISGIERCTVTVH